MNFHRAFAPTVLALAVSAVAAAPSGAVGLSAVGALRIGNQPQGPFVAEDGDGLGQSLAVGDFDGDGVDDLAIGIPFDDGPEGAAVEECGAVVVRRGVRGDGVDAGPGFLFLRQSVAFDQPEPNDLFGWALAACDFDGDGFDDLAVGSPLESFDVVEGGGAVQVHSGSPSGLGGAELFFGQDTAGVPGTAEASDALGWSLACGDFDADGFADLAVGLPGETLGIQQQAGAVLVVEGSSAGLRPDLAQLFDQETFRMPGEAHGFERFGWAVAAGDFDGDGFADLAIGVPVDESIGGVHVLSGGPSGPDPAESAYFDEGELGGVPELSDQFGSSFAVGDFDGDGRDDLAIGEPSEDAAGSSIPDAGQVAVVYGSPAGPDLSRGEFWHEDNVHFPGASEAGDDFGKTLAAGDFDRDGRDDLAIGHPGEFLASLGDGATTLLMGSSSGLDALRHGGFARGIDGLPGPLDQQERFFGDALAAGDFDDDGYADLAIGAPGQDEFELSGTGDVVVLRGALFADGFGSGTTEAWTAACGRDAGQGCRAEPVARERR